MKFSDIQDNIAVNDDIVKQHRTNTRQPRLTIKHLLKLRKIRELKALEHRNLARQLELIYASPENPDQAGF